MKYHLYINGKHKLSGEYEKCLEAAKTLTKKNDSGYWISSKTITVD